MTNATATGEPLADSVSDAAKRIGVSRAMAYNLIRAGSLTAKKLGRRTLVERSEQLRFLASLPVIATLHDEQAQ